MHQSERDGASAGSSLPYYHGKEKKNVNASLHQTIQDKKNKHAHFSEYALRLEVFSQSVSTYDMELFLLR
jgi:hypothetical protein